MILDSAIGHLSVAANPLDIADLPTSTHGDGRKALGVDGHPIVPHWQI